MIENGVILFFTILILILSLGLLPVLVDEQTLYNLVYNLYHDKRTNLDIIRDELFDKQYLIKEQVIDDDYGSNINNCNATYYFVEPVCIVFDIDSKFKNCSTYKEFTSVNYLTVFALNGDIECHIVRGSVSKSLFLFADTHRLRINISSCDK